MKTFNIHGDLMDQNAEDYGEQTFSLLEEDDIKESIINIPANSSVPTTIDCKKYNCSFVLGSGALTEIPATGTIDPDSTSTGDANLINNNLTDLVYNNSSSGSANKSLPAFDLGSVQQVDIVSVWWWNNTYTSTNYKIQISNDGVNWTDKIVNLNSTGQANQKLDFTVNDTFRYFRVFNITGTNASWVVISEMKAYASESGLNIESDSSSEIVVYCNSNGKIEIENVSSTTKQVTVNYL